MNDDLVEKNSKELYKAGNRFKDLVCAAINYDPNRANFRRWSLQIVIFQVTIGFDWYFSISGGLLNLLTDEAIMNIVEEFVAANPPCEEEIRSYCFIDQLFNINDIFEIQERIHALYLDPAYCQNCTLTWDEKDSVFRTNVNGSHAYFAYQDILKANECARDLGHFERWVSMTKDDDKEIDPFLTKSLSEKKHIYSLNLQKSESRVDETTTAISSNPYK